MSNSHFHRHWWPYWSYDESAVLVVGLASGQSTVCLLILRTSAFDSVPRCRLIKHPEMSETTQARVSARKRSIRPTSGENSVIINGTGNTATDEFEGRQKIHIPSAGLLIGSLNGPSHDGDRINLLVTMNIGQVVVINEPPAPLRRGKHCPP